VKCQVSLEAPSDSIVSSGGKSAVSVTAPPECAWTASSDASWITGLTPSSGQGNGRVEFQATANPAATMRQGRIAVNDQQIPVQQQPAPCRFEVSPLAPTIDAAGGTLTIAIAGPAGCGWQASGGGGWIAISSTSGSGAGSVGLRVSSNAGATRSAALLIAGQTVTVTQSSTATPPPNCVFSLDRATAAVSAAGGPLTVTVSGAAGCPRTATSEAPWITVAAGAAGTGPGAVTLNVAPNGGAARVGTVAIAGHAFTITQAAAGLDTTSCAYSIAPASQSVGAAGGAGAAIALSTAPGCPWTATSQAPWITVTSPASGSGATTVRFTVAVNTAAARIGTLAIAGQTFTLNQAAGSCAYSISPNKDSIGAKGGAGKAVAVSAGAGCSWTATSNDSWITVTEGATGSGNGTVRFAVDANKGKQRTGTLTIAGQTFTVDQDK